MNTYKIRYVTENGFIETITIDAVNRVMAWDEFNTIAKNFDDKVAGADCFLVGEEILK